MQAGTLSKYLKSGAIWGFIVLQLIFFSVAAVGCGDDANEPKIPSLDGRWSGTTSDLTLSVTLTEDERVVTGSGTLSGSSTSIALAVDGSHVHPDVSLTMSASGYEDMNFTGEFINDEAVRGELRGSGFNGETLTLSK